MPELCQEKEVSSFLKKGPLPTVEELNQRSGSRAYLGGHVPPCWQYQTQGKHWPPAFEMMYIRDMHDGSHGPLPGAHSGHHPSHPGFYSPPPDPHRCPVPYDPYPAVSIQHSIALSFSFFVLFLFCLFVCLLISAKCSLGVIYIKRLIHTFKAVVLKILRSPPQRTPVVTKVDCTPYFGGGMEMRDGREGGGWGRWRGGEEEWSRRKYQWMKNVSWYRDYGLRGTEHCHSKVWKSLLCAFQPLGIKLKPSEYSSFLLEFMGLHYLWC